MLSMFAPQQSALQPVPQPAPVDTRAFGLVLPGYPVVFDPAFQRVATERGFSSPGLMSQVAHTGSVRDMPLVPEDVRRIFVTAFDIAPAWHVKMQAAFQRHCDNAVSKTINLPASATVAEVRDALLLAYRLQCKGITVFRNGSKGQQVLYRGSDLPDGGQGDFVIAAPEYAGGCPDPAICEF